MKKINTKEIKIGGRNVGVVFCVFLLITSIATVIGTSKIVKIEKTTNEADNLSYTFLFKQPNLEITDANNQEFILVEIDGCLAMGKSAGEPMTSVKPVSLMLPPMKTVTNVEIIGTPAEVNLNGIDLVEKTVFPYQNPVPFGSSPGDFIIDDSVYSTDALYPGTLKDDYQIGYSHGYAIFNTVLNPVQYNPVKGKLDYYPEMTINIELEDSLNANPFFRNDPNDEAWVENLVYNSDITDMYTSDIPTFDYPGGLCDPSDNYDYVIITTTHNGLDYWDTTSSIPYNWDSLMNKHASDDGLSCTLVTVQDINACTDYHSGTPLFNDQQAHIREFCKDAYQDWETNYILIGADGESQFIPARDMDTNYEKDIDADIYWSNLDNTFNADQDNYWGEEADAGFDLYTELFTGRLTCDTPQDVSNWMTKSFYYADSIEDTYIDNAAFYGGDTTWSCQGDDFIDYSAIKGTDDWLGPQPHHDGLFPTWAGFQFGFESWNAVYSGNQFNLSVKWTAEPPNPGWQGGSTSAAINGLKNDINNDQVTLISAIAHANPSMSLDVYSSSWESNYHNTKPFFIHDYGCHCGDMDAADDGVLHSMLFHSDTELAFACIYNTCYGWGNLYCTNSSSAFQQKAFWDYFLDIQNNSQDFGNWQLGKGQAWSKDIMVPTINWDYSYGTWRAIIQGCLLFGDPAQTIKSPHPSDPPTKPTKPSGKTNGVWFEEYTYTSSATDPNNDQIYYLFDWDDGASDLVGPYPSGQTAVATHAWTVLGTYEVRVKAKDEWGAGSQWSDSLTVIITDNTPPTAPDMQGPASGKPGVQYLYNLVSTDAENQNIYYYIDWGDGTNSSWFGPYDSGEMAPTTHSWAQQGTYVVKAKAKDIMGGESDWSTISVSVPLSISGMKGQMLYNLVLLRHQTIS